MSDASSTQNIPIIDDIDDLIDRLLNPGNWAGTPEVTGDDEKDRARAVEDWHDLKQRLTGLLAPASAGSCRDDALWLDGLASSLIQKGLSDAHNFGDGSPEDFSVVEARADASRLRKVGKTLMQLSDTISTQAATALGELPTMRR